MHLPLSAGEKNKKWLKAAYSRWSALAKLIDGFRGIAITSKYLLLCSKWWTYPNKLPLLADYLGTWQKMLIFSLINPWHIKRLSSLAIKRGSYGWHYYIMISCSHSLCLSHRSIWRDKQLVLDLLAYLGKQMLLILCMVNDVQSVHVYQFFCNVVCGSFYTAGTNWSNVYIKCCHNSKLISWALFICSPGTG